MKPVNAPLWMTLDELARSPGFEARLADEFPQGAASWPEGLSRRRFLQLAGASIALAGLNGCMRLPDKPIIPYTDQPEKLIPGRPLHFATTVRINGHPRGVLVTQNEGRPTHIAGNPMHPLSLGATDAWTTASLLDLYDPERLQGVMYQGNASAWSSFVREIMARNGEWNKTGGTGLCLLTAPLDSPTELRLIAQFLAKFPQARWYSHDPIESPQSPAVTERLHLDEADVIFALESNFLYDRPDSLALTRAFSRRRSGDDGRTWNRLYVAESCPTITGIKADHRFPVAPQDFDAVAAALLAGLQGAHPENPRWPWLGAMIDDLRRHPGRSLIAGGRTLSAAARQALATANGILGNSGKTISLIPPPMNGPAAGSLSDLVARMHRGDIGALFIFGGNPAYDAPADYSFATLLEKIPFSVQHAHAVNETSAKCRWTVNAAHDLEAWGDAAAIDGTLSIAQPLIAPLYQGKSAFEVLSLLTDGLERDGYDIVRETWQQKSELAPTAFETQWHRWLRDGVVQLSAQPGTANPSPPSTPAAALVPSETPPADGKNLILGFRPSDTMWDGRHANNGWLQELSDPLTKLTWDNAVLLSPATAQQLSVRDGAVVALQARGLKVEGPALIVPGHADQCLTLTLGYGRTVCGETGRNVGANAGPLRHRDAPWFIPLEKIERTGTTHPLARTQEHFRMEERDLLHVARVDESAPNLVASPPLPNAPSLYPDFNNDGHRWALTIDLNTCIGCNACILACQSENNIPVVGKDQVLMGREMQWIRVDRYYQGDAETPRIHFQPVTCMQCEKAPCEVVCPVAATQHDDEGLNAMIYNRCVGTRYCSNNCPYKVRRFNFLFYNADIPESQRLRLNPNVTVRSRGVMEKCTYCVQRIEEARIAARRENRPLRGENIVTSCQAACPAEAIVFGDLSDPNSAVSKNRLKPGHYVMLEDLDTRPRTTYLEKRINPNPVLEPRDEAPSSPSSP